jgi:HSP20 family protein
MDVKKWVPWNWFKKEEEDAGKEVPVQRSFARSQNHDLSGSLTRFHQDIDRLFDQAFRGFDLAPFGLNRPRLPRMNGGMIKPTLDLSATDTAYTVAVEVPGVDEKDVKVEIVNDTLTIRGEKKHEKEENEKNYYRMERSYGAFQRVLSLPDDADQDGVSATFKNGVLTVSMPRMATRHADVRQIEVQSA